MIKIIPYCNNSDSIIQLKAQMGDSLEVLKPESRPTNGIVINWGNSGAYFGGSAKVYNKPDAVYRACNKIVCLRTLHTNNVSAIPFTTQHKEAKRWLDAGTSVVERHLIASSGGAGIKLVHPGDHLATGVALYTQFISSQREVRIHVFNQKVIDYVQKYAADGHERQTEEFNPDIKNLKNGWIFIRDGVTKSQKACDVAVQAIKTLGLDFGAVDVIIKNLQPYVLEINTAPGVMGTTCARFAKAFKELEPIQSTNNTSRIW